jgi:23S rRNA (uracil1939-C5)-methyltransferase
VNAVPLVPAGCEPACHGCRHRNRTLEASLAQKQQYLHRALEPWVDRLAPVRSAGAASRFGYRDRVTLNARWDDALGWRFGLMRRDELVPIHDCPVHTPRVNRLVAVLRRWLPPFTRFPLAFLHVAGGQATLIVKAKAVELADLDLLLRDLAGSGIDGLWVHCHPAAGRRLFARSGWQRAWGAAQSVGADGVVHGPTSFQQLLPSLHAVALDLAEQHLAPSPRTAVLDLYCGIGVSLRRWARTGAATLGVELGGDAVACARRNAPGAEVLRGTCAQRLPQVRTWSRERAVACAVYANPPRSGLEPEVLAAIATEFQVERIAYLSCSAGTLARDLATLDRHGHTVVSIVPFDFFPGTHHVECLALVERRVDAPRP